MATRRSRDRWLATAAMVAGLSLAACGGGSDPGAQPTTPPGTPVTSTALTSTAPMPSTSVSSTTTVTTAPVPRPTSTIVRPKPTTIAAPTTTVAPRPTTTVPNPPTCAIPSQLLGRDITVVPTSRKVVALTFDAGASNDGVASILATLSAKGVPATFFLTGDFVDAFPSSARAMARYPIGNHTYNHPDLTTLSDSRIRTEINSAESRIRTVTGQDPRPYFRFPFGAVNTHVISIVNSECYVPFRWSVDTLGWKGTSEGQSVSTVVSRVLSGLQPGEIVLMHVGAHPKDTSTLDADALPRMIDEIRSHGYGFVTLEAVLGRAP